MTVYFQMNLMIAVGYLVFSAVRKYFNKANAGFSAKFWLRQSQLVLMGALVLVSVLTYLPKKYLFTPPEQAFSSSIGRETVHVTVQKISHFVPPETASGLSVSARPLMALGFLLMSILFLKNILGLVRSVSTLPRIRRIGRTLIVVSQKNNVPFSTWIFGKAYIVLPESILLSPSKMRLAVRHEVQHHRQHDTVWIYFVEVLKIIFFMNPFIYLWSRLTNHLQEFACDEFLVRVRKVSLQAYGGCLLEAAESALGPQGMLVGTTSMSAGFEGNLLKRRIDMLFEYRRIPSRMGLSVVVLLGTAALVSTAALAARSVGQDRKLTYEEAVEYAKKSSIDPKFPVEMNKLVYEELNHELGSPENRESLKQALIRMKTYAPMIQQKIEAFELAEELMAVPIVESRYLNYNRPESVGSGLWGFIVSTGKAYGLHITKVGDPLKDERLVEHRETLAGMRYFTHLRHIFSKDWRLALRAYNEGEEHVQEMIIEHGTNDPWKLEEFEKSKENYLPKVIAAVIIMRNPALVD